jgi:hypothetical protein
MVNANFTHQTRPLNRRKMAASSKALRATALSDLGRGVRSAKGSEIGGLREVVWEKLYGGG